MMASLSDIWVFLARTPLLWLTVTLLVYLGAVWLYRRSRASPFLIPVLTAVTALIGILTLSRTPYPAYFEGAKFIHFLIGPATVALAIPLYGQLERLKQIWLPVGVALLAGSVAAIVSAVLIAWGLGASLETLMSLAPKAVAERFGGLPSLAAAAVAITGITGTIMARPLLNLLRIDDPAVRGFSVGLTAHAIGTARALQVHETAGAFAALAMGLNGVATALLMPLILVGLQWMGVLPG
jgi:putative effector of murein hydrolase